MSYYLLLYHGENLPPEESKKKEIMASWDNWTREISNAVVDGGNPLIKATSVTQDDISNGDDNGVTAYTIIEAEDEQEAVELSRGAPALSRGGRADVYKIYGAVA